MVKFSRYLRNSLNKILIKFAQADMVLRNVDMNVPGFTISTGLIGPEKLLVLQRIDWKSLKLKLALFKILLLDYS